MAAMVGTEAVVDAERALDARDFLQSLLAREDVQSLLVSQGIDPQEAKNRLASLTDQEAIRAADQLQELPAGGDFIPGGAVAEFDLAGGVIADHPSVTGDGTSLAAIPYLERAGGV